jgi:hypothetical protein
VQPVPVPYAVPYSPFGFGFGLPFSPFGGMYGVRIGPSPLDLIILGGLAYGAYTLLTNRIAGSQWDNEEEGMASSLGNGVTVLKLQVGSTRRGI